MFTVNEIQYVINSVQFQNDYSRVQQELVNYRAGHPITYNSEMVLNLSHFIECVLSSAPSWEDEEHKNICQVAGTVAELLSLNPNLMEHGKSKMRIRSALLYEIADQPALSSAIITKEDLQGYLKDIFCREGAFDSLDPDYDLKEHSYFDNVPMIMYTIFNDIVALANYVQGKADTPEKMVTGLLAEIAKNFTTGLTSTEIYALKTILQNRIKYATRSLIEEEMFDYAIKIKFPVELWATQVKAIKGGLLNPEFDSWGFAAPTGTGKTFLTRLLILKYILQIPDSKILYIVPSKALVYEVTNSLNKALENVGFKAGSVSPQIVEPDSDEIEKIEECSVIVLTPEKADLLIRLGAEFIKNISLVIVDEAHHIEAGTRGVLLEMYLWRIKHLLQRIRVVFLSAVAPNINQLAEWMGDKPESVIETQRSTRMRAGVYRIKGEGRKKQGCIDYSDGTSICLVEKKVERGIRKGIVQLAEKLVNAGPVLIVANGKGESENLAKEMCILLAEKGNLQQLILDEKREEVYERLDSRLEREMYASVMMRDLLKYRIAYHHAGLPPRVRVAVEEAIKNNLVDYVFATTTLAEGVNFPFSSVIVESIALKEPPEKGRPSSYHIVTPRTFWNIAGRAGRPGHDKEGQVILFEPSLRLEKVNAVIDNYLNPSLNSIEPVTSAITTGIREISEVITREGFDYEDLNQTVLPESLPRRVHGTINLLRIGLIHARAIKLPVSPEEIIEGSFAAKHMDSELKKFAIELILRQAKVIDHFFANKDAPSVELVAELGLSIETLTNLREYVISLEDWQIKKMVQVVLGGKVNINQVQFIVGPVAARMAELEGPKLGGFYTNVIVHWLSGVPLSTFDLTDWKGGRLENLISVIYSRIQYLLPWGLYAMDKIVEVEAQKRNLNYNNDICSLAYLADAGVPNFDALRLVGADFERVDATRLAQLYHKKGGLNLGVDVIGWILHEEKEVIEVCVKGFDKRRIDYDLFLIIDDLKKSIKKK